VAGCCVYRFRFGYDLLLPVVSAVIEVTWRCDFGHEDAHLPETGGPAFRACFLFPISKLRVPRPFDFTPSRHNTRLSRCVA
jgi:hypothetical protein